MSSSLTKYFGIRRESTATLARESRKSDATLVRKSVSKIIEPQPVSSRERIFGTRNKARQNDVLHKIKRKSMTRSHKASGQPKFVQSKLPAHVRFARLAHNDVADPPNRVPLVQSVESKTLDERKTEVVGSKNSDQVHPESASVKTLELKSQEITENAKVSAGEKVQSPRKSKSCPNTPLKNTPASDALRTKEQIDLNATVELRRHSEMCLPYHMERLFELFRACETLVSIIHNRSEVCSFDKIKPAVEEVVRCNFTEKTIAQFHTIYPSAYSFRYEKQLDRITKLQLSSYTLVLVPNLRTDGTQMAADSPTKGHLVFSGTRLIQRRHIFYNSLLSRVKDVHRKFLVSRFSLFDECLPDDASLRRWHPAFPLDTAVPEVELAILPPRPSDGSDAKITSARDAVAAFRARALFREAKVCEEIAAAGEQKFFQPVKFSDESPDSGVNSPDKNSTAAALKGVSAALLAKVREREKQINLSLLKQTTASQAEKSAFSALPATITQIWSLLRSSSGRPVPLSRIATRLAQSSGSGLSPEEATSRIENLLTLMPDWVERVEWARPHLRFKGTNKNRPLKEVIDEAKAKVADMAFH